MTITNTGFNRGTFFNVRSFGASGDGRQLDTLAIQEAVDACHAAGGGTVWLEAGQYLTGAIFFRDDITLHLEAGASLLASQNATDYPIIPDRWEGLQQSVFAPLITGNNLKNITIEGRGVIDGRGDPWWAAHKQKNLAYPRPRLIGFTGCNNVLIENITLTNSPSWTINPVRCNNVNIRGITIINPPDSPNTDGINPDSCQRVRISDCYISAGDDCIAIKAGVEAERDELRKPCRDIAITNCIFERGHGGVVIGSETSGGVQNIVISNCIFIGTDRGIRLKSRRGRGGFIENVRVSNLIMDNVLSPLTMNLYYACGAWGNPLVADKSTRLADDGTPHFRNIHISQVTASNAKITAGFIYGLGEAPIEDISLSNISISMSTGGEPDYPEMADGLVKMLQAGLFIRNVRRLRLDHVEVTNQVGNAIDVDESSDVEIIPIAG